MNQFPTSYHHRALHGISTGVDNGITGQTPFLYLNSCRRTSHLVEISKMHRTKLTLLRETKDVLKQSRTRDYTGSTRHGLKALVNLPAAIVHDSVKPFYHLIQMTIASLQSKRERGKAEDDVVDEILESLSVSYETILKMVSRMGLGTSEALKRQVQEGGYCYFLTLARLLEAYASRFAPQGEVYLGSQKRLQREHCSGIARLHFDQIHNLKEDLISAGLPSTQTLPDAAAVLEEWLGRAVRALNDSFVDRNDGFQTLRNIRDEIYGLVLSQSKGYQGKEGRTGDPERLLRKLLS